MEVAGHKCPKPPTGKRSEVIHQVSQQEAFEVVTWELLSWRGGRGSGRWEVRTWRRGAVPGGTELLSADFVFFHRARDHRRGSAEREGGSVRGAESPGKGPEAEDGSKAQVQAFASETRKGR